MPNWFQALKELNAKRKKKRYPSAFEEDDDIEDGYNMGKIDFGPRLDYDDEDVTAIDDDDDFWWGGQGSHVYRGTGARTYTPAPKKTGFFDELTKSNTLVFHKDDPSTRMLCQVYEGKNWDVITSTYNLDEQELFRVVDAHERLVFLGHGSGYGLIGMFGPEMAPHIKGKKVFAIWCNADEYFTKHKIGDGQFVTGNMPSEVWECRAAGCGDISANEMLENITYWSLLCAQVTEKCLEGQVADSVKYIRANYILRYGKHPVTRYNAIRTKVQGTSMQENEKEVDELYNQLGIEVDEIKQPELPKYDYRDWYYKRSTPSTNLSDKDKQDAITVDPEPEENPETGEITYPDSNLKYKY